MSNRYYTSGYQQSAQSAGYTSVDQVRTLQNDLNKKGAGLTVDGIWGPKTDSAYRRYITGTAAESTDYLSGLSELLNQKKTASYDNPYAKELLELITPKDDAEYRRQAEAALTGDVNDQLEALAQDMETNNRSYEKSRRDLKEQAEISRRQLDADYAAARADVETAALRRGMGRSSYLTDNLTHLGQQHAGALAQVDSTLARELGDVNEAQLLAQQHYQQTVQRLREDLADDLAAYETALRDRDRERALSAYETLMNSYDTYQRYRADDILSITTLLYEASLAQEKAAAQQTKTQRTAAGKSAAARSSVTRKKTDSARAAANSSADRYYTDSWLYMNHPSGM